MKVEIPEVHVIKGDIELSDTITKLEFAALEEVFRKCKNTPLVRLILESPSGDASIEFSNWEMK